MDNRVVIAWGLWDSGRGHRKKRDRKNNIKRNPGSELVSL